MRKSILIFSILSLALASCSKEQAGEKDFYSSDVPQEAQELDPCIVPGELIVEFTEEFTAALEKDAAAGVTLVSTKAGGAADAFAAIGATSVRRLYDDGGEFEPLHRKAGLHRWYRISYDPSIMPTKAGDVLSMIPGAVYVEPERKIKCTATFNDPYFSRQWHYYNDGSKSGMSAGSDVNCVPVWENYTAGSPNVIVSVVDGGIQLDHPDLVASTIPAGSNGSKNFCSGYVGYTIYPYDHGTHVAGTIGATNNNGKGVCGIAGGKDGNGGVKLLSCQVFMTNPRGGDDLGGDTYNAMVWGADHGAVISQNSWGYVYKTKEQAAAGGVGSMKGAIDYFNKYAGCDKNGNQRADSPMKGGLVIFAAGNDNWPDGWPAEYDGCVAVGSFGANYNRAYYSNYGSWVDICAPGGDYYTGYQVYSTTINSSYQYMQGTSMACPHVSGVAALIVSYFGGPGFTSAMLKERLIEGANKNTRLNTQNIGPKVDALGSFTYGASNPPAPVTDLAAEPFANNLELTWSVTADKEAADGKCYSYMALCSEKQSDFNNLDTRALPSTMMSKTVVVPSDKTVGSKISTRFENLDFEKTYYMAIVGVSYTALHSTLSNVVSCKTMPNNPPVIETDYDGDYIIHAHENLNIAYHIYDPDGHKVNLAYKSGSAADSFDMASQGLADGYSNFKVVGTAADAGTYTAIISATDVCGELSKSTVRTVRYKILPNHAPEVLKPCEGVLFTELGKTVSLNLDEYFTDPDGEPLSYAFSHTNPKVANANRTGLMLSVTSLNYGIDQVTVTAKDAKGETCDMTFSVIVRKPDAPADVYPTNVTDTLTVGGGVAQMAQIMIFSSSGQKVFETSVEISAFKPAKIDMSAFPPGVYRVRVIIGEQVTDSTIVKL